MTSRDERVAANEAVFRDANEIIREQAGKLAVDGGNRVPFLCECADTDCTDVILLTIDEYEAVRANPDTFAIVRGHEATESETVLEGTGNGFAVVQKRSAGRELAEHTDPRR